MSANQPPSRPTGRPINPYPISSAMASSGGSHPAPEDLVIFAMQLFSADESAAISQHLERCADCRDELARIHSDLALTAATVDLQAPPEAARQRLLQQIAREKKIVPIAQQPVKTQGEAPPPLASFGRTGSVLSIDDHPPKHTGRTVVAVAGWAVAAALAVAVTFQYRDREAMRTNLLAQAGVVDRLNTDAASAHRLMDALTDPAAMRVTLTTKALPKAQPIGAVTYNPDKGTLVFLASNLDPLQAYKAYELWVIPTEGKPIPAGTFHPDDQGNANVIMPDLPKGVAAKAFGVTIEPDGGSQSPTSPIILSGN
jgi:anti-sigma-K factor RskA